MADASQRQDPENLQNPEKYEAGREPTAGRANPPDDPGDTYDPSTVQVNRGREQGLGMGQKDLDYQRDATGALSFEQRSFAPDPLGVRADPAMEGEPASADQAGPPGPPDEAYDDRERDQLSFDWPAG